MRQTNLKNVARTGVRVCVCVFFPPPAALSQNTHTYATRAFKRVEKSVLEQAHN